MSCLTFFFMVLSIVCNPTFAVRTQVEVAECKNNIELVFPFIQDPFSAFKYATFMLSEKFINSMTTTRKLAISIQRESRKYMGEHYEFNKFKIYADEIENLEDTEITEKAKKDISGYFRRLYEKCSAKFDDIEQKILSPAKYCETFHKHDIECRNALTHMFQNIGHDFDKIPVINALEYCYHNYSYHEFFDDNISSESGSSSTPITREERLLQFFHRRVMKGYYKDMMGEFMMFATSKVKEDRIGECIANVRHVFNEAMLPYFAFNFAMFSLSDSVIKSMTTAAELANHFKENKYAIFQYGNADLNEKHEELIDYFSFAVNQTEDRSNTSLESKKDDILGYFKSLIVKVEKARFKYEPQKFIVEPTGLINEPSRLINVPPRFIAEPTVPFFPQFTMSPKQFCKEVYKGEDNYKCRASLAVMFRKGEDDLKEMDIKEAFIYCYRYYTHLDFTMYNTEITDNLLLQKKLTGGSQEERLKWALNCMVNYFSHLMNVAYGISAVHMNISDSFPTVEDYCKSAVQLQHKGKHSIVSKSISFKK